jgi:diadenosine tetraphosphate (Ap4A) HIT family hydrolase
VSVFLALPPSTWVASNALAFAVRDAFPVSPGHTLVVTRRVVPDWFSASEAERAAVMELVERVKRDLDGATPRPDGYNVGFNAGEAAGQTVMHLHVHVIPRYRGDVPEPRGGVRHVIAGKGNYLAPAAFVQEGGVRRIEGKGPSGWQPSGASLRLMRGLSRYRDDRAGKARRQAVRPRAAHHGVRRARLPRVGYVRGGDLGGLSGSHVG